MVSLAVDPLWPAMTFQPYPVRHWKTFRKGWVVWQSDECTHCVIWFPEPGRYEWRRTVAFPLDTNFHDVEMS